MAVAGFVFGLFGTFTGGPNVQIAGGTCLATGGICSFTLTNTGSASATITGCTIYGATANAAAGGAATDSTTVAAGTTSAAPDTITCTVAAGPVIVAGAAVSGQLIVASGSPLAFSATAS